MTWSQLTPQWLRRLRGWAYVLVGTFAAFGLAITWRSAFRAEVGTAIAGAITTLCALGAGLVWMVMLRLGMTVLRDRRRLARLERRVGVGDTQGGDRTRGGTGFAQGRISSLIARVERFCDAQENQAAGLERRIGALESSARASRAVSDAVSLDDAHWADDESPPGERTMAAYDHLVALGGAGDSFAGTSVQADANGDKKQLRLEFAALIHQHSYTDALATGDALVNRFPDSKAAADFRRVRPHLVRKIQLADTARHTRGG